MEKRNKWTKSRIKHEAQWYSFILPTLICLALLTYLPMINSVKYSLYRVSIVGFGEKFIGLKNYQALLSSPGFWRALSNTLVLALMALIIIPIGFILAVQINSLGRTKAQAFFRASFYLPKMLTGVSVVMMFRFVLLRDGGLINAFLSLFTSQPVQIGWLTDPNYSKISATILLVWQSLGYIMLLNLAGIQSIPLEIYEAAEIDGCNMPQKHLYITVPNMSNTFTFIFITNIISSLARFSDLFVLGGNSPAGNPAGSLQTILMYIYQYSFASPNYGISTAGSMILFVMIFIVTLVNLKVTGFFKSNRL